MDDILIRGVTNIIPGKNELEKLLSSDKKLNVYLGIDPTATKIHLGHAMPLRKIQAFANLGHNVTFLIGDFTALIGDTSDKDSERPILTKDEIDENFQTYKAQAEKILDFSKIQVKHNSDWLSKLTFEEIIKLSQEFSVGDLIGRELIRKRLTENKRVGLHELLYPVMQGYDSYFMDTDVQVGGADQVFNMQAGRILQKKLRNKDSFVLCTDYLMGTDGRKMSKSWGNAIWLTDEPFEMYRKVMSINDDQIKNYFLLGTRSNETPTDEEISKNPMNIKKKLAEIIVTEFHSEEKAKHAREEFERVVQNKEIPENIEFLNINASDPLTTLDILINSNIVSSRSEAKRLIEQNAITIDDKKITNSTFNFKDGQILKVGKGKVFRIKTK